MKCLYCKIHEAIHQGDFCSYVCGEHYERTRCPLP